MPGGKGITDIWMSENKEGKWSTPVNVEDVNTEGREMFPFISKDSVLYFSSDGHLGLGALDIFESKAFHFLYPTFSVVLTRSHLAFYCGNHFALVVL